MLSYVALNLQALKIIPLKTGIHFAINFAKLPSTFTKKSIQKPLLYFANTSQILRNTSQFVLRSF